MILKPSSCVGCPLFEKPHGKPTGFSVPVGTGTSGVFVVAEALGENEEKEGMALVGKAGYALFQQLARVGVERESLTLFNTIACRPPDNKLSKMPWEKAAIEHCAPNLDKAIADAKLVAAENGKTFVIVTLGRIAFKRIMGLDDKAPLLRYDYIAYPFWNDRYACWVLAADHPSYLLRGKTELWPTVQFVFTRALEIASTGFSYEIPDYTLDPPPAIFSAWVDRALEALKRGVLPLSYDIETPYKKKTDEADLGKEEDADHTILRISFCYRPNEAVSVRWNADYLSGIERLFAEAPILMGWNSDTYDLPRVSRHVKVNGASEDAMVAWHILNTALPKGLGFVTPFIVQNTPMWKHLSDAEPAFYNAKDADMALRNYIRIRADLEKNDLSGVFQHHVLELNQALRYMSGTGVLRDEARRNDAEIKLQGILDSVEEKMELAVPREARKFKIAKKRPKDLEGWEEITINLPTDVCDLCGILKPARWKKHTTLCAGKGVPFLFPTTAWQLPLEFKVSKVGLLNYQAALRHQAVLSRKEHKITFDEDAIVKLMKTYPKDPLYPCILEHREASKILSTYVGITENGRVHGGMPVGIDGRIHTSYSHNPSTLRLASEEPNLQNLTRSDPSNPEALGNIVRNLVVAAPDSVFYARDYSGIEAVLVGYEACAPDYIRLSRRDVHTYYTAYALYELDGSIKAYDLPDLAWPDERLFPYLEELKKRYKKQRNSLYKHLVHAANFMQSPRGAQAKIFSETRVEYPISTVTKVMDVYYALFPQIRQWHKAVLAEADKEGFLRNAFGYVHRFSRALERKWEMGQWTTKPGSDANRAIAFKPQSTAAAIIKEALMRLYYQRFEEAGKYLRLQVHDELFFEIPAEKVEEVDTVVLEEMERPIPELRLPASYGMGEFLTVLTEAKRGLSWGTMR